LFESEEHAHDQQESKHQDEDPLIKERFRLRLSTSNLEEGGAVESMRFMLSVIGVVSVSVMDEVRELFFDLLEILVESNLIGNALSHTTILFKQGQLVTVISTLSQVNCQ
jgi:hypothetical protein